MRTILLILLLRWMPGVKALHDKRIRIIEGQLIFLERQREDLSHERVLDADRNMYLNDLAESLQDALTAHRMMREVVWGHE